MITENNKDLINHYIDKLILFTTIQEQYYNKYDYVEVLKKDCIDVLTSLSYLTDKEEINNCINEVIHNLQTKTIYNNKYYFDKDIELLFNKIDTYIRNQINLLLGGA